MKAREASGSPSGVSTVPTVASHTETLFRAGTLCAELNQKMQWQKDCLPIALSMRNPNGSADPSR
jgi:hypothetical protein